jgi:hypothetical protein
MLTKFKNYLSQELLIRPLRIVKTNLYTRSLSSAVNGSFLSNKE